MHHLVPLASERCVQPYPADQTTPESGRPTESGIYKPYFTFPKVSADSGVESNSEENLSVSEDESEGSDLEYPATMTLERSSYRESVSFGVIEPVAKTRCLSVSQQTTEPRMKEGVIFGPGLKPVSYQNRMTVSVTSSWKSFKSTVNYEQKIKPIRYSSTCYIRPCYVSQRFVSLLDYRTDDMKWYQCTLELRPKTYSSSKVGCFEMNNNEVQEEGESDDSEGEQDVSVFLGDGLVSPHIVNAKVWDYTDANTAPRSFRNSLRSSVTEQPKTQRASIVVNGAAEQNSHEELHEETDDFAEFHQTSIPEYHDQQFLDRHVNETELVSFDGANADIVDDSDYGTTSEPFDFSGGQVMNGYGHGDPGTMDYVTSHPGLNKYVKINGYGGSSGSLDEIDL